MYQTKCRIQFQELVKKNYFNGLKVKSFPDAPNHHTGLSGGPTKGSLGRLGPLGPPEF